MAEKPKFHSKYYYIDLYDDWSDFDYTSKESVIDQTDRYNFATTNWSYELPELESRTYEILHELTTLEDPEIAEIMVTHEHRINKMKKNQSEK